MSEIEYYGRDGRSMTLEEWGCALADPKYKIVEQTLLDNGYWVSTVWLGLDHGLGGGRRAIFETMVFDHDEDRLALQALGEDGYVSASRHCERYATEAEARHGHACVVGVWSAVAQ